jgi:riboflavin synthase
MFTGIISAVGQISSITPIGTGADHGVTLRIQTPAHYLDDVGLGDSIAIQGACMTATKLDADLLWFECDVSRESLNKTVGLSQTGSVNLEKALRTHDRLGGHMVTGHVDGVATVHRFELVGESWLLQIAIDSSLSRFLAYKGSVTVNGVSLTVNQVQDQGTGCLISINLIPHTIANTSLGNLKVAGPVNIEIDLIARYVERMLSANSIPLQNSTLGVSA